MSYTALARQWRPRTFSQLLGQDHIKKALINSLDQERIHHAYLFTGTRGVGKTSIARLFAKSLSCEQGITATPCLQCSHCLAIEQGCFLDLIEIDGASKTRVEDTRELLENIQYVPSSGRFKIYLIDEIHMLSQHSFNALLKTLEEPPEHVKFLLATTDPQKLPVTVLSRCLQFTLKPLSIDAIVQQLTLILDKEQLVDEQGALSLIAKAARGSMRDALSLLDQAIVGSDGRLYASEVKQLLGYSQQDYALELLHALGDMDVQRLLSISQRLASEGGQFKYVIECLLSYLHHISIYRCVPNSEAFIADVSEIKSVAQRFTPEDTQLFYHICLKGLEELDLAPSPVVAFDMMLLRLYTFKPAVSAATPPLAFETTSAGNERLQNFASTAPHPPSIHLLPMPGEKVDGNDVLLERVPVVKENVNHANLESVPVAKESVTDVLQKSAPTPAEEEKPLLWDELLSRLNLTGLTLSAAENAVFLGKEEHSVSLQVDKRHQSLFTTAVIKRLEEALSNYYQAPLNVVINCAETPATTPTPAATKQLMKENAQQLAEQALQDDPFFQQLQQEFSAELIKNSITPQKNVL